VQQHIPSDWELRFVVTTFGEAVAEGLPPWLCGPWGSRLIGAITDQVDEASSRILQASFAPRVSHDPPEDALAVTGEERGIQRYPGETAGQYRARLDGAWLAWSQAGSALAILSQLEAAGLPGARLYRASEWSRAEPGYWSVFWVYVSEDYSPPAPSAQQAAVWASIVRKWKAANWICGGIILQHAGSAWGTGGTWGASSRGAWGRQWGVAFGGTSLSTNTWGRGKFGPTNQTAIAV
jgi:hypothetical protein